MRHLGLLLLFIYVSGFKSFAGDPIWFNEGEAIRWSEVNSPVIFTIDQGDMGSLSNSSASRLIRDSFEMWDDVDTSWIEFEEDSNQLPVNVTGDNFASVNRNTARDLNPVYFDDDGSIVDALLGQGARFQILGVAGPTHFRNTDITRAQAIFNGFLFNDLGWEEDDIFSTILHEIGHFIGLGHTQLNEHLASNNVAIDDVHVPVMYPVATDDDSVRDVLTFDDEISISNIYPTSRFESSTGRIRGVIKRGSNELPGVNVIARNVEDPLNLVSSTVSGTYNYNSGEYFFRLPDGDYWVEIEPINRAFTDASRVGRYADTASGLSFQNPVKKEYFNEDDRAMEARSYADPVPVRSFTTRRNVDIVVDEDSITNRERAFELLGVGTSKRGAMMRNSFAAFPYLLDLDESQNRFDFTMTFPKQTRASVRVQLSESEDETPETFQFNLFDEEALTIVIADGGDVPLEDARYVISIQNLSDEERTFVVELAQNDEPVPTRTPTATPTVTDTPQPTIKSTFTPTPTVTPTNTPVPSLTPTVIFITPTPAVTPTPDREDLLAILDLNGDQVVNSHDVLMFDLSWMQSGDEFPNVDLNDDDSKMINQSDLLEWIHYYRLWQVRVGDE